MGSIKYGIALALILGVLLLFLKYIETRDLLILEKSKSASYERLVERINNAENKTQAVITEIKRQSVSDSAVKDYLNTRIPDSIVDILRKSHLSAVKEADD